MARFDLVSLCSSAALALPQGKELFCPAKVKSAIKADIRSSHPRSVQKPLTCWSDSSDRSSGEGMKPYKWSLWGQVTKPSILPSDGDHRWVPRDAGQGIPVGIRYCSLIRMVFLPNNLKCPQPKD